MIYYAADQLTFILYPNQTTVKGKWDYDSIIASSVISLVIFGICLMKHKALLGLQVVMVPLKIIMLFILSIIMILDYGEWHSRKDSLTRKPRQRGDVVFFEFTQLFLPLSWLYSSLNINNLLPGAVCLLENKNSNNRLVLKLYHIIFGLIILIGGVLYVLNFGNAEVSLYKHYSDFDSGFHEIEPLWAYLVAKLLAFSPIYFAIVGKSNLNSSRPWPCQ